MADRKISELVALTTPAAGDYLPIVDISEVVAVSRNKRITIEELLRGAPDGTAAAPSVAFESSGSNGIYLAGTNTIGISTNGTNRLSVSTTAVTSALPVALSGSTSGSVTLQPVAVAGSTVITLPATTGIVVTTGDSGTVTSTMIANGTIVDADINASAAIADTKLAQITTASKVSGTALTGTIPSAVLGNSSTFVGTTSIALNRSSANQALTGISSVALPGSTSGTVTVQPTAVAGTTTITLPATTGTVVTTGDSGTVTSTMIADGTIVNGDINASAAIAGTKISPDFGSQNTTTTGTNTAASFIPSSSTAPTNGLYLPAANSVALATGGSGRLFINSSGNIGINVSSPTQARLVVASSAGANTGYFTDGTNSTIKFLHGGGGAIITTESGQYLGFGTADTERLRITSGGLVGIGTSSPSNNLTVVSSSTTGILSLGDSNTSDFMRMKTQAVLGNAILEGNGDFYINRSTASSASFFFQKNGTTQVTIDNSGRVGIGSTSPGAFLHVKGGNNNVLNVDNDGSTYTNISIQNNGTEKGAIYWDNSTTTFTVGSNATSSALLFRANNAERARIDSSGRLGIGTTLPTSPLHVSKNQNGQTDSLVDNQWGTSGASSSLTLQTTNTSFASPVAFIFQKYANGTASISNTETNSAANINFTVGSSERARINNTGYLTGTVNGLSQGLYACEQYYRLNADLARSDVSTAQSIFGVGVTLIASTVYEFEMVYTLSKTAGTTSHTIGVGFGGTATLNNIFYELVGVAAAAAFPSISTPDVFNVVQTATNTTMTAASALATRNFRAIVKGTVSVNAGGTFIPQFTLSAAPGGAYSTLAGSYVKIAPLGASGANTSIGSWA